jgi:coproporphyrinogen III oxidase
MQPPPTSVRARRALDIVETLQASLVARLEQAAAAHSVPVSFAPTSWLRDGGIHGGGTRWGTGDNDAFDRASVNVSAIHYDDLPTKSLAGATALSTIVHPRNPHAPSMHMHISHTEMRSGRATWRIMADLNPSIPYDADRDAFASTLSRATGELYEQGAAEGDRYFFIPALGRHRGVTHYYLESWTSGDPDADEVFAKGVGDAVIDQYGRLIEGRMAIPATDTDKAAQRAYHTLYLFQVLTLDRGTTSGLLVHDENDVGIMGSLPSVVDPQLLASWAEKVPSVQRPLVEALVAVLGASGAVTIEAKKGLAEAVREHYRAHPEALELQARGSVVPPTVANHR